MSSPADAAMKFARVEPLTRTRAVRGPFDYRLPPGEAQIEVGTLLRVPFGGRSTLGVVVALAGQTELEPHRLAEPEAVLEGGLPEDLVALAWWMAAEYCSTPARALGLMLSPGAARGAGHRYALVAGLTAAGQRALAGGEALTDGQRAALERLRHAGPTVAAALGTSRLRRLERRGLVSLEQVRQLRRSSHPRVGSASSQPLALTTEQAGALAEILAGLDRRSGRFLLHGVTGSGKTEVYLQAVEAVLESGRDAIVLVPEIGLTPQLVSRFEARLGPLVAVLHSKLSQGERHDEWWRLRRGEARVCVGPRSAVFAPLSDVGLIVVDEEHDSSYKHEGDPRYDARTVAGERARHSEAVVVCGTATPRPESVVALRRLRLLQRVDGRPLPPVEVLDMRGAHHPLHPETRLALSDLRRQEGKAIVLLNRRGWSNFLSCRACGRVRMCPNCEVALVLHRSRMLVACHHCGHREAVPEHCPACGSAALARHGAGTERLEHELEHALGGEGFPVFRLDADVAASRVAGTLARFGAAPAGVLVGTQMVAKGHDFPDVRLGVVLDADQTLRFPDFRAEERTFALVTQLAGRAGRGDAGARVLVQTLAPDARSIRLAASHDVDGFLDAELGHRQVLGYPPFGSLIRIQLAAAEPAAPLELAQELARRLSLPEGTVLGPAPLFRLRGRSRAQVVVKSTQRALAIAAVGRAVDELAGPASKARVSLSVDVDPQ
jgi:primosomal protein N' (replication factor Y)